MNSKSRPEIVLLFILCVTSVLFTLTLFAFVREFQFPVRYIRKPSNPDVYTFIGDDVPATVPNMDLGNVAMVVEESVRYSFTNPESRDEWYSAFPFGMGSIRLGPDYRAFFIGLYHENHCLQQYRNAFAQGTADIDLAHIHHCLNYLRLWSLCRADLTLEPGDFAARNFTEDRLGVTHTCRNWNGVIDRVNTEWDNWIPVWRELHNISTKLNHSTS